MADVMAELVIATVQAGLRGTGSHSGECWWTARRCSALVAPKRSLSNGRDEMNSLRALRAPRTDMRKERGLVARDETVAFTPARQPATAWRLISHLELAALPTAAGSARKHARAVALEFGLSALADTIELIVSEVVTNAVRATSHLRPRSLTTPVVRLWLAFDLHSMLIRIWDASSQMPARQDASPDDESGRGLMLVDCLASDWGAYREEHGKVVWVVVG